MATWVSSTTLNASKKRRIAVILHGIMGTGRNWMTPAKKLVERNPEWSILLTDLRGHGANANSGVSGHKHTIEMCARDVRQTLREEIGDDCIPDIVAGHSFGGKVALAFAASAIDDGVVPPREVWVIDSLPGPFSASSLNTPYDAEEGRRKQSTEFVLRSAKAVASRAPFKNRAAMVKALKDIGVEASISAWLASATRKNSNGGLLFQHNFETLQTLYDAYRRTDLWSIVETPPYGMSVSAIVAGRAAWQTEDLSRLHKYCHWSTTLHESGHNVHVDDLPGTLEALQRSFDLYASDSELK